ncbi:hypothetical protein G2W53_012913 [Senna tora]|uniref:Uncharacterized protein n=1 Tax=Senna tora TaxID=362788 RepID=A0A834TXW1_9FABA|nr:hypothetical protein G2W53_012913 [Senna tora]
MNLVFPQSRGWFGPYHLWERSPRRRRCRRRLRLRERPELPKPLILRRLVPLLAHASRHGQRPGIHVLQHLEQEIVIEIHTAAKAGSLLISSFIDIWQLDLFHLDIVAEMWALHP